MQKTEKEASRRERISHGKCLKGRTTKRKSKWRKLAGLALSET